MGRTVLSFRPALDREIESWKAFARGLRPEERDLFENLADYARVRTDAGSLANRPLLSEILFMCFAIEHEKVIGTLCAEVRELRAEMQMLRALLEKKPGENNPESNGAGQDTITRGERDSTGGALR